MISFATITILLTLIYFYYQYFFGYWKSRSVPTLPVNILVGNLTDVVLGKVSFFDLLHKPYQECKSKGYRYIGYYFLGKPILIITDLDLIKSVLVKDFVHFTDREFYINEKLDPLSAHLVSLRGEKWKNMRKLLSPAFTSSRLKMMYPYLTMVAQQLELTLQDASTRKEPLKGKDFCSKYIVDVIGMCIFGIECNTLKNQNLAFQTYGKQIIGGSLTQNLKLFMCMLNPQVLYFLKIPFNKSKVQKFFLDLTKTTVEQREKNKVVRKDMMHSLIQLRNNNNLEDSKEEGNLELKTTNNHLLTTEEIAAEALIFFGAAYETTSSALLFWIYQFICNPDIQEKARKEVNKVLNKHGGEITFDGVMEMPYLEMCFYEIIRVYPPASTIARVCTKNYIIPDTQIVVEEGTTIFVPAYEIMQDPEYYPEPEKFIPERWSPENIEKIPQFARLGFGEGPHICIGQRLSLLMAKTCISTLLKGYNFSISSKTTLPMELNRQDILLNFKNDLFLDINEIKD